MINPQGERPTIAPIAVLAPLRDPAVQRCTLVAEIHPDDERAAPSVVTLLAARLTQGDVPCQSLTRATAPWGEAPLSPHIGRRDWRRTALERREKPVQLPALEAGMRIAAVTVDGVPLGVATPADLERARELLA